MAMHFFRKWLVVETVIAISSMTMGTSAADPMDQMLLEKHKTLEVRAEPVQSEMTLSRQMHDSIQVALDDQKKAIRLFIKNIRPPMEDRRR